jgi:hypothetical protein
MNTKCRKKLNLGGISVQYNYHDIHVDHSSRDGMANVGGVNVYPTPITVGEHVNIVYNGLLAQSGAQEVYLKMGFGDSYNWHNVSELKMLHTGRGWEQTMQIKDPSRLNFCFRDNAFNWDNNNGLNWSYEIHNGRF